MIGDFLEKYTFEYLIESALSKIPDTIDKREGSIIYDALAPACYELANYYLELGRLLTNTFAVTAVDEYLELRVAEQGLVRYEASYAERKGTFTNEAGLPMAIPLGSRFSSITDTEELPMTFVVVRNYEEGVPGEYVLRAETEGVIGNQYTGNIIPITFIQNLKTAVIGEVITPGRDAETDDDLRRRYMEVLKTKPFGGNVTQYDQLIRDISGVGEVQVYPIWDGPGSVLLSVVGADYLPIGPSFIDEIQQLVDPTTATGQGIGMAPIGHRVTVNTPDTLTVNLNITVNLVSGYTLQQIEPLILDALNAYFMELRNQWGVPNDLNNYLVNIYIARLNSIVFGVQGVANVSETLINGLADDLTIEQTASDNKLPILGTVNIYEA